MLPESDVEPVRAARSRGVPDLAGWKATDSAFAGAGALERALHWAESALDAAPDAIWLVSSDGAIRHANAAASALHRAGLWASISGGRLRRLGQSGDAALQAGFRDMAVCRAGVQTLWAACVERGRFRQVAVHLVGMAPGTPLAASWPGATVLVILRSAPEPGDGERVAGFASHHRLTTAETRVLSLLVEGHELPVVASRLGIAYSTVRSHVRMLLEKTGSTRQAELLRKVGAR